MTSFKSLNVLPQILILVILQINMATLNTVLHPKLDKHGSKIFRLVL